ncbi:MAG: TerB family tellurite resistance protein [Pirellulaceae bacterium]
MDHHDLFNNLMVMAAADGKLADEEIDLLVNRARRWGISRGEVAAAADYAKSDEAEFVFPPTVEERRELLAELMRVMAVDGELADVEKKLFAMAASAMEISQDELNTIIDSLLAE